MARGDRAIDVGHQSNMLRAVLGSRSAPVLLSLGGGAALVALYMWRRRLSSAATTIKPLILFDVDGTLAVPCADTKSRSLRTVRTGYVYQPHA